MTGWKTWILAALTLPAIALAAVQTTQSTRITLKRGNSNVATPVCPSATCPSREICLSEADRLAKLSTVTSGTVNYFCDNERFVVTAVYSPNPPPTPVDCVVGPFVCTEGEFSQCIDGQRTRTDSCTREVTTQPSNGGAACPPLDETRTVTEACTMPPVDCVVSEWSAWSGGEWSQCVSGSQSRTETRTRTVLTQPANGGQACPTLVETRTATQTCTVTPPPTTGLPFVDGFEYSVGRLDAGANKIATFQARGWQTIKDETTRPGGARGYLYTTTNYGACPAPPDQSRVLVMEGLSTTMNGQTDYYTQYGGGEFSNGKIPPKVYFSGEICLESGEVSAGVHSKFFYVLYGTRTSWPMANEEQAGLFSTVGSVFNCNTAISRPVPGAFAFMDTVGPNRASVACQVSNGVGGRLGFNVTTDGWVYPREWTKFVVMTDLTGATGVFKVWLKNPRDGSWRLVSHYEEGVTQGFVWPLPALDKTGGKGMRMPTTQGPGVAPYGPDVKMLLNYLEISNTAPAGLTDGGGGGSSGGTGEALLRWTAPTARTDGSPLTNLSGFRVRHGRSLGAYDRTIPVSGASQTSYTVTGLESGQHYFVVSAVDSNGIESENSAPATLTLH